MEIDSNRSNKLPVHEEKPGSELFHYTTAGGLLGILQSNSVWATQATFCNDADETKHGLRLLGDAVASYMAKPPAEDFPKDVRLWLFHNNIILASGTYESMTELASYMF